MRRKFHVHQARRRWRCRRCRWRWASRPVAATTPARATPATAPPSRPAAPRRPSPRARVKIAFSAPGADHGWMAAITENARRRGREARRRRAQGRRGRDRLGRAGRPDRDADRRASPTRSSMLPNEGDALTPVAQKAMAAGIPVINIDREFTEPRRLPHADHGRQLRHRLPGRQLLRRPAQVHGQRGRDPGHRRHLGHRAALAGLRATRSRSAARTASRSSPASRPTSSPTRACR